MSKKGNDIHDGWNEHDEPEEDRDAQTPLPRQIPVKFPWCDKSIIPPNRTNADILYPMICRSRMLKTPQEIEVMKVAVEATSEGHVEMMRKCKPGIREAHLMGYLQDQGIIGYNVKAKAYPDIVASGPNAAILHYEVNNRIIQPKEMVLCDCAHRICGYCADITTTFPSDGKFTPLQKLSSVFVTLPQQEHL